MGHASKFPCLKPKTALKNAPMHRLYFSGIIDTQPLEHFVSISRDETHTATAIALPSCVHFSTSASRLRTFSSAVLLSKHVWPVELCICFSAHVVLGWCCCWWWRGGVGGEKLGQDELRARRETPPIETTVRAWAHVSLEAFVSQC